VGFDQGSVSLRTRPHPVHQLLRGGPARRAGPPSVCGLLPSRGAWAPLRNRFLNLCLSCGIIPLPDERLGLPPGGPNLFAATGVWARFLQRQDRRTCPIRCRQGTPRGSAGPCACVGCASVGRFGLGLRGSVRPRSTEKAVQGSPECACKEVQAVLRLSLVTRWQLTLSTVGRTISKGGR
jgi:hypothetical protein